VYLREHGLPDGSPAGRVAYFPMDIDRTFWDVLAEDHLKIMRNTVDWATNERQAVEVSGPGVLDVTAWHDRNAVVIHLVNLTNPMAMKGPYREFFPVGQQKIKICLPEGSQAKAVHLLVADKSPAVQRNGQELTIIVPSILDHEVVAIDI
jgi:hypothetical protein